MMQNKMSKEQLLDWIDQVSFAVNDMTLFLDTHPDDEEARAYFEEKSALRNEALEEYAALIWTSHHRHGQRYLLPLLGMGQSAMAVGAEQERRLPVICGIMKNVFNTRSTSHVPNAKLAQIIISQYGGPDGEMGASMRYLSQRFSAPNRTTMGVLNDVATETLDRVFGNGGNHRPSAHLQPDHGRNRKFRLCQLLCGPYDRNLAPGCRRNPVQCL